MATATRPRPRLANPDRLPLWMLRDWLPELSLIEWPRLEELRDEHHRLLAAAAHDANLPAAVRQRFEDEDRAAADLALAVARGDATDAELREITATSEIQRRAELQVAEETRRSSLLPLCAHVRRCVHEIHGNWDEVQALLTAEVERLRFPDRGPDPEPIEAGSPADRRRSAERSAWELRTVRDSRRVEHDQEALGILDRATLSAGGENVLAEIASAERAAA